jgi:ABC-type arginine transport system permease subunit
MKRHNVKYTNKNARITKHNFNFYILLFCFLQIILTEIQQYILIPVVQRISNENNIGIRQFQHWINRISNGY